MKRDQKLQLKILRKIEDSESAYVLFTQFSENVGGYEDETAPDWSAEEAYNIRLLLRDGLLASSKVTDAPSLGLATDDVFAETYVTLTSHGHDFLEAPNWWQRAYRNVAGNFATLIAAVLLAVITQYVLEGLDLD